MSIASGDMSEVAITVISIVMKIAMVAAIGAFVALSVDQIKNNPAVLDWASAFGAGAVQGFLGVGPPGG